MPGLRRVQTATPPSCGGRSRKYIVLTALLLALLLSSLGGCDGVASRARHVDAQANQIKLLRYIQRVSAAVEDLLGTKSDMETSFDPNAGTWKSTSSASSATTAASASENAARTEREGLSPDQVALAASTTSLPDWLHSPQRWLSSTREAVAESATRVGRLLHVVAGGALPEEGEDTATLPQQPRTHRGVRLNPVAHARLPVPKEAARSESARPSYVARTASSSATTAESEAGTFRRSSGLREACLNGGARLLPATSTVRCHTASGDVVLLTALQFSQTDAVNCELIAGTGIQCLCPPGTSILRMDGDTSHVCVERDINVVPHLAERHLCYDEVAAGVGLPATRPDEYCVTTTRHATLTLDVTWRYELAPVSTVNASDTSITDEDGTEEYVVMGTDTVGTLAVLRETLFLSSLWDPQSSLKVTQRHSLFSDAEAFTQIYCFSSPAAAKAHRQSTMLNATSAGPFFGGADGITTHTVTIDLSTVNDEMIEGNQLYIETGVRGGFIRNYYRVARLHVSFSDLPVPPVRYHYTRPMNVLFVALIVLMCLIVISAVLVVVWCLCTREEPEENDVVSRTVRKREEKKHTSSDEKKKT